METETENRLERHKPKKKAKKKKSLRPLIGHNVLKTLKSKLGFQFTHQSYQIDLKIRLITMQIWIVKGIDCFVIDYYISNILYNNYIAHLLIKLLYALNKT